MRSLSESGAKASAKELKAYADIYGLDGFDFDDEYSSYAEGKYQGTSGSVVSSADECTPENYKNLLEVCREIMPKEDGLAFGIYWYTSSDHPKGEGLEDLIDYTVYGTYGKFSEYSDQSISKKIQAPYAITLVGEDNSTIISIDVNEALLNNVTNNGYKYFAFYNLKSSRNYEQYFNKVAAKLWNNEVTWTGNYFGRTDLTAKQGTTLTYSSYLGEWTVTPSAGLYLYYDENDTPKWWDWKDAPEFNITITEDVSGKSYKVYGWDGMSITQEYPFTLNYSDKGIAYCPSPQTIGTVDGTTYAMARATYGNSSWNAVTSSVDDAFVLEASTDGGKIYMYNSARRYGFSLFTEEGDTYTAVENVRNPHSCGMYTLERK